MALRDQPYLPLYVQDFLTDERLCECSAESTGVYIRLMCLMHKSERYGEILLRQKDRQSDQQILNFAGKLARQMPYDTGTIARSLAELLDEGVLSIDGDRLFQRRMVKDNEISEKRSAAGAKGAMQKNGYGKGPSKTPGKHGGKAGAKHPANSENEIESENEYEIESEYKEGGISSVEEEPTPQERTGKRKDAFDSFANGDRELLAALRGFEKMRQKIKKPLTDDAKTRALKKLVGLAEDREAQIAILNQSEDQCWQGLFALRDSDWKQGSPRRSVSGETMDSLMTLHQQFDEEGL